MSDSKKIRERLSAPMRNIFLAAGLVFLIGGIFLLIVFAADIHIHFFALRSLFALLFGGLILYRTLTKTKKSWLLFTGLFLCLTGCVLLLSDSNIFSYTISDLWPVIVICGGLSLGTAGFYRTKYPRPVFLVPAAAIIVLGAVFLLFSLDVIVQPFSEVAARWWPSMLILMGIGLVVLFFSRSRDDAVLTDDGDDDFADSDDGERR
ncbi:LiaI-LiaF-like domain-containing protein [Treponema brennaborense]|uniref:LiaI-LiaF-like transmembrane region domain-containing protein n=1 Tax=Treponema brennaborense (strain DSM 12168 / CIP 105900 / DD5/3) TaxID=906968 RepID=F4LJ47_TREBD|nr:DUF5668 domain-containing protein [Treponema brennaborense]AEE16304.1 hypothetical protein Trebr_0868 [Treponema brennaborense DSM 12168]